eukprot:scaffold87609_cov22-Tisochrysis_lutea.AAC.1
MLQLCMCGWGGLGTTRPATYLDLLPLTHLQKTSGNHSPEYTSCSPIPHTSHSPGYTARGQARTADGRAADGGAHARSWWCRSGPGLYSKTWEQAAIQDSGQVFSNVCSVITQASSIPAWAWVKDHTIENNAAAAAAAATAADSFQSDLIGTKARASWSGYGYSGYSGGIHLASASQEHIHEFSRVLRLKTLASAGKENAQQFAHWPDAAEKVVPRKNPEKRGLNDIFVVKGAKLGHRRTL